MNKEVAMLIFILATAVMILVWVLLLMGVAEKSPKMFLSGVALFAALMAYIFWGPLP